MLTLKGGWRVRAVRPDADGRIHAGVVADGNEAVFTRVGSERKDPGVVREVVEMGEDITAPIEGNEARR